MTFLLILNYLVIRKVKRKFSYIIGAQIITMPNISLYPIALYPLYHCNNNFRDVRINILVSNIYYNNTQTGKYHSTSRMINCKMSHRIIESTTHLEVIKEFINYFLCHMRTHYYMTHMSEMSITVTSQTIFYNYIFW